MDTLDNIKDIAFTTGKVLINQIPIFGELVTEYFTLAKEKIADKRFTVWMGMVESKLAKLVRLEEDINKLSSDEFLYSFIQSATAGAQKTHQNEKREFFANALYNAVAIQDISEEKKLIFLSFIDRYTLVAIKLLYSYSEDQHILENHENLDSSAQSAPEFAEDRNLVFPLMSQLAADGLIETQRLVPIDTVDTRRTPITPFGEEFLRFITDNSIELND